MIKEISFNSHSLKLHVNTDADNSVFEEIFRDKEYRHIEKFIKQAKSCIIDIGAHAGYFSGYTAVLNPNIKVLALEPEEENFKVLKENLRLNHFKNVIAKNVAVAAVAGNRVFFISENSHNHSLIQFDEGLGQKQTFCVTMEDIFDRYLRKEGVNMCDLVKMDCEGAEFEILENMDTNVFKRINAFFIEYHEYSHEMKAEKLRQILIKNGFVADKVYSFYDKRMGFIIAYRKAKI